VTPLKEIMTPQVEVISADTSAATMNNMDVGVLPVSDGKKVIGMLTDRDIVLRVVGRKLDPKAISVGEAMTRDVVSCFEDQDVQEAAMLMVEKRIRRLAVLNRENKLVGIVSLGDLAVHTGNTTLGGEVLEYVSQPAEPKRRTAQA
jgi:CBS domain-containing protein